MGVDALIVVAVYNSVLAFRFAGDIPSSYSLGRRDSLLFLLLAVLVHLVANRFALVYRIVNRYIGLVQATHIMQAAATTMGAMILIVLFWPLGDHPLPLSVVTVAALLSGLAMVAVRFYGRIFHERTLLHSEDATRVLIVGAGRAAEMLLRDIQRNRGLGLQPVGLVDDDPSLMGMRIHQYPVLGSIAEVPQLAEANEADEILIAIPSAGPDVLAEVYRHCRETGLPVKTLPGVADVMSGRVTLSQVREIRIEDLLGRPKVETDLEAIAAHVTGKRVLVTGAGGSIGSELCRQLAQLRPGHLALVDRDESGLYQLHEELRQAGVRDYELVPTNILQERKIDKLFAELRPQLVFHAAAFKHVPLMEMHPDEAVLNNVRGTQILAEAAVRHGVETFVNISTDKAVDPVNVMGATKRVGEHVLRRLSLGGHGVRFCSVRFGNVLGSRGSVIPIFEKQIKSGGPLTITDPEMTRYFMMIEEAVQLVLQSVALTGEIKRQNGSDGYGAFVLEMGQPVPIMDLARQMIDLLAPDGKQIEIEYSGLRPGERLHEELFCTGEVAGPTSHPLVRLALLDGRADNASVLPANFGQALEDLLELAAAHCGSEEIIPALQGCVPTYRPFDWTAVGTFPGAGVTSGVGDGLGDGLGEGAGSQESAMRPTSAAPRASSQVLGTN